MSQITIPARLVTSLCAVLLLVAGCGTPNEQNGFDADAQKHLANWVFAGHADSARTDITNCQECHGEDLQGGISTVACSDCHVNGPSPATGCTSCHGNPPTGTTAPNRTGAHPAHYALPDSAIGCGTCHNNAGTGTANHYNGAADISVLSGFNAKSGTAVWNTDGTCSKVSCHGGQTTPPWNNGSINVTGQCTSCHVYGAAEFNSFSSGKHDFHVNTQNIGCIVCHNTTTLAVNHFTSLHTTLIDSPAAPTVATDVVSYAGGSCTTDCHTTRSWW